METLDGYWVNIGENDKCQVVIFDEDKFIRGNVNTEPTEYAFIIDSQKIEYNKYNLIVNMKDKNANEERGVINIDLDNVDNGEVTIKVDDIDEKYIEYKYISDNEEDVFSYCEQNI